MAVTTKKTFAATTNATTTVFSPVSIQLHNQDDLDVYVKLSGGTRVLQLRQATTSTAQSTHPQVNNTDGLYYPAVSAGTQLYNYQLSTDNNTITFNTALPQGAVVFCERRTRDASGSYTTFASGSTIRAKDLNDSAEQSNFTAQEARNKAFDLEGKIYNTLGQSNLVVKTTDTGTVTSTMIADGTIVNADINASADIQGSKLLDDSVTLDKLGSGALPTDITVASANIVDGTIVNADVNTSAAIAGTKISPDFGSQVVTTTGNIVVGGTVDGRDVAADGTKLDTIETGATADQTNAEIRTAVEAATDSNVFTDADHSKLNAIEAGATADQTNAEIKTAYEANANTNEFSDAEQSKLAGIETAATADQTSSEIKTLLQSDKLTLSEMNTTSLDSRYFTETECEAAFLRQDSSETIASGVTWSSTDSKVATTAAIDLRIIDLVDDVGGFVAIPNEDSFPNANPDVNNGTGTIISIKAASTNLTPNGSNQVILSSANLANNADVLIKNVTATIPQGFGFLVETTTVTHEYTFHRLVPKATEVATVAANAVNIAAAGANITSIDSFADRYQVSTSAPTDRADGSNLVAGDLWFDSSSNKVMMVYDASSGDGFSPITPNQATLTNINIVAGHVTYTEDLGNITDALNTGSGNNSVNTVGAAIANVNTAATNIAKITTVADDLNEGTSEIDTVATNIANVNAVGTNISNVNAVNSNATNINAVQANATNINAVSNNTTNINTVATNNTNINTVAGANSNITAVAGSISNVNTAATNIANINTTASNIAQVNSFANVYRIASSNPSTSLDVGDLYFNTTSNELRVYNGSSWQGGVTATGNLAGLGTNTFSGLQTLQAGAAVTGNITVSGTVDGRDVATDGTKLDGIEASATADQTASEIVSLISGQTIAPNVITTTNLTLDFGSIA